MPKKLHTLHNVISCKGEIEWDQVIEREQRVNDWELRMYMWNEMEHFRYIVHKMVCYLYGVFCVCIEVWPFMCEHVLLMLNWRLIFDISMHSQRIYRIERSNADGMQANNVKRQFVNSLPGVILLNSRSTFSSHLISWTFPFSI